MSRLVVRRRRRKRSSVALLGVPVLLGLGLAGLASAASLGVSGSDHALDDLDPCTTATLTAAVAGTMTYGNYTQVSLGSVPATCNDLAVGVVVYDAGGLELASGTGNTGATGTATITTTSYRGVSAAGVALLVDTWGVRTTWTVPPWYTCVATNNLWVPITPTVNCTFTNVAVTLGTHNGYQTATLSFRVGNMGGYTRFVASVDFAAAPPFPGWTPVRLWRLNLRADPTYACSRLPFVSFRGRTTDPLPYRLYETLDPVNFNPGGYTRICP